jgi:hypothetical protein
VGPIAEHGDDAPAKPPTAASWSGCNWFFSTVWPRSLVDSLTYKAARLVAVAILQDPYGSPIRQRIVRQSADQWYHSASVLSGRC